MSESPILVLKTNMKREDIGKQIIENLKYSRDEFKIRTNVNRYEIIDSSCLVLVLTTKSERLEFVADFDELSTFQLNAVRNALKFDKPLWLLYKTANEQLLCYPVKIIKDCTSKKLKISGAIGYSTSDFTFKNLSIFRPSVYTHECDIKKAIEEINNILNNTSKKEESVKETPKYKQYGEVADEVKTNIIFVETNLKKDRRLLFLM